MSQPRKKSKPPKSNAAPPAPVASQINENCNNCGACLPVCPTKSIFTGERRFMIDADTCSTCLLCAAVCPVDAVTNPAIPPKAPLLKF